MPRQPEGRLVKKLKEMIEDRGGRAFKIVGSENSFQEVGIPDLLWCYVGRFITTEVKQPGEPLRPAQRIVLMEVYRSGGVASVIETRDQMAALFDVLDTERKIRALCFDRGRLRKPARFS